MLKPHYHYLLAALSLWFVTRSLATQSNGYVTLGKARVHPTRIVAKSKTVEALALQSTAATLSSLGVSVTRHLEVVPGLVVLDLRPRLALQSVEPLSSEAQATALLDCISDLENSGLFDYVQPCYLYSDLLVPSDARFADDTLWGLHNTGSNGGLVGADIDALHARDITTGATNVIVAVQTRPTTLRSMATLASPVT